ncbi:protein COFACTOR ASSEMBLY OF COMPLEX C SUBUNIT B CCB3, chloroplastic isoform X1 [Malania oleifera]|uniref:protein COFACTOR ASSEMBLY OF COMPLEX C SUBUNIT B CCB3, chloroplastic isoform X1 n=1 Tax=Malania oleifera TaxID=397392 RepID=UPI0025ADB542|nr:protein COFACTOR ASSEMBLY OF COMPLEX C SUBUNIT B CCB3, chloroplastic isoform X1 [Malania oleifera]
MMMDSLASPWISRSSLIHSPFSSSSSSSSSSNQNLLKYQLCFSLSGRLGYCRAQYVANDNKVVFRDALYYSRTAASHARVTSFLPGRFCGHFASQGRFKCPIRRNKGWGSRTAAWRTSCLLEATVSSPCIELSASEATIPRASLNSMHRLVVAELDPTTAKLLIGILGPFLSVFSFLFILRIVMSWYPGLPVGKFPFVIAHAPTEPLLVITRKLIPPLGGVDVTPVVWFGLISFLSEILVGPQGLLVLLSQQV